MNKHRGSTLDSLFEELGESEEVAALAAKKILAVQASRRMKELGLSTTTVARQMKTSRAQLLRVLDEGDAGVTLRTLFRLSRVLEMPLKLSFDAPVRARARATQPRRSRASARPRRTTSANGLKC
jgi:plasmid maintenance system antidote protein VapI